MIEEMILAIFSYQSPVASFQSSVVSCQSCNYVLLCHILLCCHRVASFFKGCRPPAVTCSSSVPEDLVGILLLDLPVFNRQSVNRPKYIKLKTGDWRLATGNCRLDTPVSPFPLLVFQNSPQQMLTAEIGPVGWSYINFGIGNLPQKEIADSHLSAGSNKKIRVRNP
jgi:hypothetical protein